MTNEKIRTSLFIICTLLFVSKINAQKVASKKLFTGENIDWSDFKGEVNYNFPHNIAALSIYSLEYNYNIKHINNTDSINIKIFVQLFFSDSSWVKPNKKNEEILNHEKGHLLLGLIAARECENVINNQIFIEKDYKIKIDSIFRENDLKYHKLQDKYDLDTNHSINKDEQQRWNNLIQMLLVKNKS
jgi:hypothetical protein